MQSEIQQVLASRALALADDELILGHRNAEWCGHAPILEEDIAFANIALDEIGHAVIWYGVHADLTGADPSLHPDRMAYWRDASEYCCARLMELPRGDWAFSMLRQYLFDVYEKHFLEHLANSIYAPLAGAAAKVRREEIYHLRHTAAWVRRLGLGTDESHRRMRAAADVLWLEAGQLFVPLIGEDHLAAEGYLPHLAVVRASWEAEVRAWLGSAGLEMPSLNIPASPDRSLHTGHLEPLLSDLQQVARLYPDARW